MRNMKKNKHSQRENTRKMGLEAQLGHSEKVDYPFGAEKRIDGSARRKKVTA